MKISNFLHDITLAIKEELKEKMKGYKHKPWEL